MLAPIRLLTGLISLGLLAAAAHLLWSWQEGYAYLGEDGRLYRSREDWRLWTALALGAWSFLGRFAVTGLLGSRDDRHVPLEAGPGVDRPGAGGARLHVEEVGPERAPAIIFTHGWGMDRTYWRYARADLQDRFRLVLWDLPGLGRSRAGDRAGVTLEAMAADLAGLVETAPGRPVLVGHCIGGMVIQTLLRDRPDVAGRIAGVVLLNTTYTNPVRTMAFSPAMRALQKPVLEPVMHLNLWLKPLAWLANWQAYLSGSTHLAMRFGFGRRAPRSQLEQAALLMTRNSPSIQALGNVAMFRWDSGEALRGYRGPVLIVAGGMDLLTRPDASREMAAMAGGGARLEVVPDANHMGPQEAAGHYNALIADFVLSVQPAAAADGPKRAAEAGTRTGPPSSVDREARAPLA